MREDVLTRKLLADGEGAGEERRFQLLMNALRNLSQKCTPEEAAKALRQVELVELSMRKQSMIADTCNEQREEFEQMTGTIEKEILDSKEKMSHAKDELAAARLVRRNRQEYALLARMIEEVPSRADSSKKLEDMQEELNQQHERQRVLEAKLCERRNHLHAFNIILANFQKFLNNEDEEVDSDERPATEEDPNACKKDLNQEQMEISEETSN